MPPRTKPTAYHRKGNDPCFDLRRELYRIAGVDLTDIPGVSAATAQVILTEIGTDVSRFRNASAFASWLGRARKLESAAARCCLVKTRKVKHRAATTLHMGASCLCRAKGYFGEFFRRMRAKLDTTRAITAAAHKIARILYHVLLTKEPFAETVFHRCDEQAQQRAEMRPRKPVAQPGFQPLPISVDNDNSFLRSRFRTNGTSPQSTKAHATRDTCLRFLDGGVGRQESPSGRIPFG